MKETGLMFKAPLVRAILSGQKTQTRRICKLETVTDDAFMGGHYLQLKDGMKLAIGSECVHIACPTGGPGDRIYVRETFAMHPQFADLAYRAEGEEFEDSDGALWVPKWTPAIHMPRKLARICLEITGVRIERLQSISRGDAMAEGCPFPNMADGDDPRKWFAELWDSTTDRPALPTNENSKRYARVKHWLDTHPDTTSWAANPWVWVIDFKRIEKPL